MSKLFACYLSAIVHDYNHFGFTNDYLKRTGHDIAKMYNDASPMENFSLYKSFGILTEITDLIQQGTFRKDIIALVMATDMTRHFDIYQKFCHSHCIKRTASIGSRMSEESNGYMSQVLVGVQRLSTSRADSLGTVDMQILLKCADIGHTCLPTHMHVAWVKRLEQEYFNQGRLEKKQGLSVSPLFDPDGTGVSRSQVPFFKAVVMPLYEAVVEVYPRLQPMFDFAKLNAKYWESST
jgi:hypothetical protein